MSEDQEEQQHPFFHYYGMLVHQQNMLQDDVRTGCYYRSVMDNLSDFKGKVVLDVGTGSGILAMFCAMAGARKVYAVEASDSAECAQKLVDGNGLGDVVKIIKGKVEEIDDLPEKVDVVISEPMGFLLVHERMLESYLCGRDRFLKPNGGKMFPSCGCMYFLPFSDWSLWEEQKMKSDFWCEKNFYGVDLSVLKEEGRSQHFSQPVVGVVDPSVLIANDPVTHGVDFLNIKQKELLEINVPFKFVVNRTCLMHGMACWFDVDFNGSEKTVRLSTGPFDTTTHWYQCRLLSKTPIAVNVGQTVSGLIKMVANKKYSYDIEFTMFLDGTNVSSGKNVIKLQDQMYHYLQTTSS